MIRTPFQRGRPVFNDAYTVLTHASIQSISGRRSSLLVIPHMVACSSTAAHLAVVAPSCVWALGIHRVPKTPRSQQTSQLPFSWARPLTQRRCLNAMHARFVPTHAPLRCHGERPAVLSPRRVVWVTSGGDRGVAASWQEGGRRARLPLAVDIGDLGT